MAAIHREDDFTLEGYEEFYENHYFQPLTDKQALKADEVFPRVGWALDIAKETGAKTVLDLGCLEGYSSLTLANLLGMTGIGVDLSKDGIDIATRRAKENNLGIEYVQGECEAFMEGLVEQGYKFDLILCFELIEHVKDIDRFRDLMDYLRSENGTILVSTPDFEAPTFGKNDTNKCHIRLFTTSDEDYEAVNVRGETRKATSMSKWIGKGDSQDGRKRIISQDVWSELIHTRYQ